MNRRRLVLGAALLATALAAYWAPRPDGDVVAPTMRDKPAAVAQDPAAPAAPSVPAAANAQPGRSGEVPGAVLRIRPRDQADDDSAGSAFPAAAWVDRPALPSAKPMPALPVLSVPPAPTAPPLPFRMLGRYLEDGKPAVFLQLNDQNLVVRVGDTIAEQYKVESLDDTTLTVLHLPTNQRQTLNVGALR